LKEIIGSQQGKLPETVEVAMYSDDLLTYLETERFLNIKRATLYSLVSTKRIPHVRFGPRLVRFSRAALEAWVHEREVGASTAPQ
jgi:excisionase family DNA binding protein